MQAKVALVWLHFQKSPLHIFLNGIVLFMVILLLSKSLWLVID